MPLLITIASDCCATYVCIYKDHYSFHYCKVSLFETHWGNLNDENARLSRLGVGLMCVVQSLQPAAVVETARGVERRLGWVVLNVPFITSCKC